MAAWNIHHEWRCISQPWMTIWRCISHWTWEDFPWRPVTLTGGWWVYVFLCPNCHLLVRRLMTYGTIYPFFLGGGNWRIIPGLEISHEKAFGRGWQPYLGDLKTMVINHLLNGMILQVALCMGMGLARISPSEMLPCYPVFFRNLAFLHVSCIIFVLYRHYLLKLYGRFRFWKRVVLKRISN